jgi:hypothetical protein
MALCTGHLNCKSVGYLHPCGYSDSWALLEGWERLDRHDKYQYKIYCVKLLIVAFVSILM